MNTCNYTEVGCWIAVYTELFSDPPGKFMQSPYKRPIVIVWGSSALVVTERWTVIFFFVGPAGNSGLSTGNVLRPRPSRSCISTVFSVYLMDGNQNPLPVFFKIWKWATTVKGRRWFPSADMNACILPCFWHQLAGGLGRKRYKRNYVESADRADILLGPLAVYPLV